MNTMVKKILLQFNGYSEYVSLSELFIQKSFAVEPDWLQVAGCAIAALGI